jgi:hypothetical protein
MLRRLTFTNMASGETLGIAEASRRAAIPAAGVDRAAQAKAEAVAQREARKARRETGRVEGVRAFPSLA